MKLFYGWVGYHARPSDICPMTKKYFNPYMYVSKYIYVV